MKQIIRKISISMVSLFVLVGCTANQSTSSNEPNHTKQAIDAKWVNSNVIGNANEDTPISVKDDFALYVNQDVAKTKELEQGKLVQGGLYDILDEVEEQLIDIIENSSDESNHDEEIVNKVVELSSDWELRNEVGLASIMPYVKAIENIETVEDVYAYVAHPEDNLIRLFVPTYYIGNAMNDPEKRAVIVDEFIFTFDDPSEYTTRSTSGERTYTYYQNVDTYMLERIGYSQEEAQTIFDENIAYQTKFAQYRYTKEEQYSSDFTQMVNNEYTLDELVELAGTYPIHHFLSSVGLDESDLFIVSNPKFIEHIQDFINENTISEIKSFLLCSLVMYAVDMIDRDAYDYYIEQRSIMYGADLSETKEKELVNSVKSYASEALDNLYIQAIKSDETKKEISDIIDDVTKYYQVMIEENTWLSDDTKQAAIKKLQNLVKNVCYPDVLNDTSVYDIENADNLFEVKYLLEVGKIKRNMAKIHTKYDRTEWSVGSSYVTNAYYDPSSNSINILSGFLGGVTYQSDWSYEKKLASIGTVIAHEISHAFDLNGSQYDDVGTLKNWWTDEDQEVYQEKINTLIAYYDSLDPKKDGSYYNGQQVAGEAMADLTGLQSILGVASSIEDFDYDAFFTQYAQMWGYITTAEYNEYLYARDVHPLGYLRINCVVQQFDEFQKTYDIQPGDGMYLAQEDRIFVW